mmetsp:Transcript_8338/g.21532  ORF Transcript_8338/g.21532 Transcript_8338/m.21532 type:complete len:204 (-) Transcript_8338:120-731(-)
MGSVPAMEPMLMMKPLMRSAMLGARRRVSRIGADSTSAIISSHASGSPSSGLPSTRLPALLTSTSTPPNFDSSSPARASTACASDRSQAATYVAGEPACSHSRATSCSCSRLREVSAMLQPSAASKRAMARPMPRPAPVTSAHFPLSIGSWKARRKCGLFVVLRPSASFGRYGSRGSRPGGTGSESPSLRSALLSGMLVGRLW